MQRAIMFFSTVACTTLLIGCSSSGNGGWKAMSRLLGGQPDQSVFKDTTVKEALEYEYRVCLGDYEGHHDKMKACIEEAYAKVVEEKGIGERPTDGQVIIKEVGDDAVINDDETDSENDDEKIKNKP